MFYLYKTLTPQNCSHVSNIAVGTATQHLRIFVTCRTTDDHKTVVKFFDRSETLDFNEIVGQIEIDYNSQPFIADFDGDFLSDILYSLHGKLKVAFQTPDPSTLTLTDFNSSMLI